MATTSESEQGALPLLAGAFYGYEHLLWRRRVVGGG
jgi:hypothetical protein